MKLNTTPFCGRDAELGKLNKLLDKKTASLAVVKGRRRIGKSRLVQEFAKPYLYTLNGSICGFLAASFCPH